MPFIFLVIVIIALGHYKVGLLFQGIDFEWDDYPFTISYKYNTPVDLVSYRYHILISDSIVIIQLVIQSLCIKLCISTSIDTNSTLVLDQTC